MAATACIHCYLLLMIELESGDDYVRLSNKTRINSREWDVLLAQSVQFFGCY